MTDETAKRLKRRSAMRHKLDEFLPYRLNVCASLVSQALSRIYADRYKIGVPVAGAGHPWRIWGNDRQGNRRT